MELYNLLSKGTMLTELRRYAEARECYGKALEQEPEFPGIYTSIAFTFLMEEKYAEAIEYAEEALGFHPDDEEALLIISRVKYYKSDYFACIHSCETVLEFNAESEEAYLLIARAYLELEYVGKAEKAIIAVFQINGDNPKAMALLGHIEAKFKGNNKKGIKMIREALNKDVTDEYIQHLLGSLTFKAGDAELSSELYGQLVRSNPDNIRLRERLLDSELISNQFYRMMGHKLRLFPIVNYLTVVFNACLILFGGLTLRQQYSSEPFYPLAEKFVLILSLWSALFWLLRFAGHSYMKKKLWRIKGKDLFDEGSLIMLSAFVALVAMAFHCVTKDFVHFGTALLLIIMTTVALGFFIIEKRNKFRPYFSWYLLAVYSLGFLNLLANTFEWSWAELATHFHLVILLVPLVLAAVISGVKETVVDYKKEQPVFEQKEKNFKIGEMLLYFGAALLLPVSGVVWSLYGGRNIFNFGFFLLLWILFSVVFSGLYFYIENRVCPNLYALTGSNKSVDQLGRLMLMKVIILMYSLFLIGGACIKYSQHTETSWLKCAIVEHGLLHKNQTNSIIVRKPNGHRAEVYPSSHVMEVTKGDDCLQIKVDRKLFGITYASEFKKCE